MDSRKSQKRISSCDSLNTGWTTGGAGVETITTGGGGAVVVTTTTGGGGGGAVVVGAAVGNKMLTC